MICLECGCDLVESSAPIKEEYRGCEFLIEGIDHHVCPECGEYAVDAVGSKKLARALADRYAHLHGLLSPDEIVAIRTGLGLTQADFQKMLGVTGVTVSRWETGKAQQSKPMDNLLRGIRDYGCFASDLMERAEVGNRRTVSQG